MTTEEIRRDAEKTARGFMGPLALLAPMTSDVLKTAIDTFAGIVAAERDKVARLERERDEALALRVDTNAYRAEVARWRRIEEALGVEPQGERFAVDPVVDAVTALRRERDEVRRTLDRIASVMSCVPDDDSDLIEAVRERDEALAQHRAQAGRGDGERGA